MKIYYKGGIIIYYSFHKKILIYILIFLLVSSSILLPKARVSEASPTIEPISMNFKSQSKIDVSLVLDDLTEDYTSIKADLLDALKKKGINEYNLNIRVVYDLEKIVQTGTYELKLYWPNSGKDMDAHVEFWSNSAKLDELYYGKKSVYGSTLDYDDRTGGTGELITLNLETVPTSITELKIFLNPFSGSENSTMYLNKFVNGSVKEVFRTSGYIVYPTKFYFGSLKRSGNAWTFYDKDGNNFVDINQSNLMYGLRESYFTENTQNFLINLHDGDLEELNDLNTINEAISRLENEGIHYIGWGKDVDDSSSSDLTGNQNNLLIEKSGGNGIFVNRNSLTYEAQIDTIADYIFNNIKDELVTEYLLQGEDYELALIPSESQTNTKDNEWPNGKWLIKHNPDFFSNNEGHVSYHNIYLDDLITNFEKVGEYQIFYMDVLIKTLYVHRKPISRFFIEIIDGEPTIVSNSYDPDVSNGKLEEKWKWKKINDSSWITGFPTTFELEEDYLIQLLVKDQQGVWSNTSTQIYSTKAAVRKPIAAFSLSDANLTEANPLVSIQNQSYDPKGYAIVDQIWKVSKSGEIIHNSNVPKTDFTIEGPGLYKITLVVKNSNGELSEEFSRFINIIENTSPSISAVGDIEMDEGTEEEINFTIDDLESNAMGVMISATSSNTTLIPVSNLVISGTGRNRTLTVQPVEGEFGESTITLTASDGKKNVTESFQVKVKEIIPPSLVGIDFITGTGFYKAGDTLIFEAKFTESVHVNNIPKLNLEFKNGTTQTANYLSGHLTDKLLFSYVIQTGDNTNEVSILKDTAFNLSGGSIQNQKRKNAVLKLTTDVVFDSIIDTTSPLKGQLQIPVATDNIINHFEASGFDLNGLAEPDATVELLITDRKSNTIKKQINVDSTGAWEIVDIDVTTLVDGALNIELKVIDRAGNESSVETYQSLKNTINTSNPDQILTENRQVRPGHTIQFDQIVGQGLTAFIAPQGTTIDQLVANSLTITSITGASTSIVAPTKEGTYKLFLLDNIGNYSSPSTANIIIKKPIVTPSSNNPEIHLVGSDIIHLELGDEYIENGATAFDIEDGVISDKIQILGNVDTSMVGTYTISYRIIDSSGKSAEKTRTILVSKPNVEEETEDILSVNLPGTSPSKYEVKSSEKQVTIDDENSKWKVVGKPYKITLNDTYDGNAFIVEIHYDFKEIQNPKNLSVILYDEISNTWFNIGGMKDFENHLISIKLNSGATFAIVENNVYFNDIEGHWSKNIIQELAVRDLVKGDGLGNFNPNRGVTRAEFTVLIMRLFGDSMEKSDHDFNDIKGKWYESYIQAAHSLGIIKGVSPTRFNPERIITRQEMIAIAVRALEAHQLLDLDDTVEELFEDTNEISDWAKDDIYKARKLELVLGIGQNRFDPNSLALRGQSASVVYNLLKVSGLIWNSNSRNK